MKDLITHVGWLGLLTAALSIFMLALSLITVSFTKSRRVALYFCRLSLLPLVIALIGSFYIGQVSQFNEVELRTQNTEESQILAIESRVEQQQKNATHIGFAGFVLLLTTSSILAFKTKKQQASDTNDKKQPS